MTKIVILREKVVLIAERKNITLEKLLPAEFLDLNFNISSSLIIFSLSALFTQSAQNPTSVHQLQLHLLLLHFLVEIIVLINKYLHPFEKKIV